MKELTFDCGRSSLFAHSKRDDDCVIVPLDMFGLCVEARLSKEKPVVSSITFESKMKIGTARDET